MKILVYEHITGGGMLGDPGIAALAPEGELMLRALVDDLNAIPGVEVIVMRDARLSGDLPAQVFVVNSGSDFQDAFRRAAQAADAVWPIAPERNGALLRITNEILAGGRKLLGCRPDAVEIAASKHAAAQRLARAGIPVVPAYSVETDLPREVDEVVVKPDDGAGCQDTWLFSDRSVLRQRLSEHGNANMIFQPYVRGEPRSLSFICCEGRARLLACNRQKVEIADGAFRFEGVTVNAIGDPDGIYARLAGAVAEALPGLWGYCGVDFIEAETGPVVVEVNPRLTTSYCGLRAATGINPAQLVIGLPASLASVTDSGQASNPVDIGVAHAA